MLLLMVTKNQLKLVTPLTLKILMASVLMLSLFLPKDSLWAAGEIGDLAIRPAPHAPPLPPKGGVFKDPTYGTPIIRVTDRTDGNNANHSYSIWGPFNCNSTRFHIGIDGIWTLYDFDPVNFRSTKVGAITTQGIGLNLETARWHPTNPDILYAMESSPIRRKVYTVNVATMTATLLYDFTSVAPIGGYTNSFSMNENGHVLTFYSSTTGSADTGDHVTAYNLQTNTVYELDFASRTGHSDIHSTILDKSGDYVAIHGGTLAADQPIYWIWKLADNSLTPLLWNAADSPGGHWTFGSELTLNPAWVGGALVQRNLATPHTNEVAVSFPSRDGKSNFQLDSHRSWVNLDPRFFFMSNQIQSKVTGWTLHSGAIYKRTNFVATSLTARAPEGVYVNGVSLVKSLSMPTSAGHWYYDAAGDILFVWLFNNAAATNPANAIVPFAWWPFMEEIMQIWVDEPTNLTKIRRLAHHQSHWPNTSASGYGDLPKAAADRSGRYVLFDSNWGGSGHRDVFILQVPGSTSTSTTDAPPMAPINLTVK